MQFHNHDYYLTEYSTLPNYKNQIINTATNGLNLPFKQQYLKLIEEKEEENKTTITTIKLMWQQVEYQMQILEQRMNCEHYWCSFFLYYFEDMKFISQACYPSKVLLITKFLS